MPVVFTLWRAVLASRNVAYLDDIDGTLMLLMRLDGGWTWREMGEWLFELSNEHRMVTSRVMVVLSHWFSGTVNFHVLGFIGNLFLCGLCGLLIWTAGAVERRWSLAFLLMGFLFQLEHYENLFWSGSSIDHVQVPFLAVGTIILLARGEWSAIAGAGVLAAMATFTLAHGLVLWPVGALMLAFDRRWRSLAGWLLGAAVLIAVFFWKFQFNPTHQIEVFSVARLFRTFTYWLELIGAPLALGQRFLAEIMGAALLALLGWQIKEVGFRRERIALPLAVWTVGSLALVAVGRAGLGNGITAPRYYVLGGLVAAAVVFVELQRRRDELRPGRFLGCLVAGMLVFNVAANLRFREEADAYVARRDEAVAAFMQHGKDGMARATLHPQPEHATRVIREAEKRGVYFMPRQSGELPLSQTISGTGFSSGLDQVRVSENMVTISGWAAIAGHEARPGDVRLVLATATERQVLTTQPVSRPDVAAAFPGEKWRESGFQFELRRWLLPPEDCQIGFLISTGRGEELVMTGRRVELSEGLQPIERDRVAPNRMVFDELLPRERSTSVTTTSNRVLRLSFLDLHDNLVHVDFNGAGTLTLDLDQVIEAPVRLRLRGRPIALLKGHASIAITGADESTSLAVYSVRYPLPPGVPSASGGRHDGLAHLAAVSIRSRNGRFGAVRMGNTDFSAHAGLTGIDAPGVRFAGPVNVGNIRALGEATPVFRLGFALETRVAGGDLFQPNAHPIEVSGVRWLRFVEGRTSNGVFLPARPNSGKLFANGRDVSARLTIPAPRLGETD